MGDIRFIEKIKVTRINDDKADVTILYTVERVFVCEKNSIVDIGDRYQFTLAPKRGAK